MSITLELTKQEEARLSAAARNKGVAPAEFARQIVTDHLPSLPVDEPVFDDQNAAAIALLRSWIEEGATDDPEEIRKAEEELEELKRNLNANRAASGERLVFP